MNSEKGTTRQKLKVCTRNSKSRGKNLMCTLANERFYIFANKSENSMLLVFVLCMIASVPQPFATQ